MDEKRKFFRIKNKGEVQARFKDTSLHIIDISPCSVAVISDVELPPTGTIEVKIKLFKIDLNFEIIRKNEERTVLLFNNEEYIAKLLPVLKNLRNNSE
jgi:hypothetical protein